MAAYRMALMTIISLLCVPLAYGGWNIPTEIVSMTWGQGVGQVGIKKEDTFSRFPQQLLVTSDGVILVADELNNRVLVFNSDGTFRKTISPVGLPKDIDEWPLSWAILANARFLAKWGDIYQIYDINGNLTNQFSGVETQIEELVGLPNYTIIVYKGDNQTYYNYSQTGQLLKTYTERPLEFGKKIEVKRLSDKSYNMRYQYPEGIYAINVPRKKPDSIIRDAAGNLYVIHRLVDVTKAATENEGEETVQHYRVIRYNFCGKDTGRLELPQDQYEVIGRDDVVGVKKRVLAAHGQPIVAPNGDVYTWKRTPDKYSIVKWTWQDDPNQPSGPDAPTGLAVAPSTTGLYLTWKASPQDPGCVTGYEIARATSSGGVYATLATVDKGVFKYNDTTATVGTTYYYKLLAVSGTDYSPYTAEASGKR